MGARVSTLHDLDMQAGYLGAVVHNSATLDAHPVAIGEMWGAVDQSILAALMAIHARREPPSTDGLFAELQRSGRRLDLDRVLAITSTVTRDALACARRVRQLARMRRMHDAAGEALAALEGATDESEAEARAALARGADVAEHAEDERIAYGELLARGVDVAIGRANGEDVGGIKLGTPSVDRDYRAQPGHLVIVGGRPNVGKTSLTFAWHLDCAARGIPSGIVSVDDDEGDYGTRAVYAASGVDVPSLLEERGRLSAFDVKRMCEGDGIMASQGYRIGFTKVRSMSIEGVVAAVTREVKVFGARWVSIDYLTKIRGGAGRDPRERANDVLSQLERLAMSLGIPIVLLVQLKRGEGGDDFKEPSLASFKETGEIEERAKGAVLLWRQSDKPGEPVCAKNAKVKLRAAGRRFWMLRHPHSGLLVEVDEAEAKDAMSDVRGGAAREFS